MPSLAQGSRGLGPWQLCRLRGRADRGRRKNGCTGGQGKRNFGRPPSRAVISRIMLL